MRAPGPEAMFRVSPPESATPEVRDNPAEIERAAVKFRGRGIVFVGVGRRQFSAVEENRKHELFERHAAGVEQIDRQLAAGTTKITVDSQLAEMKRQLAAGTAAPQLTTGSAVVRIQGDDQYRLQKVDRDQLDRFDADLVAAIRAGDEAGFRAKLHQVLEFVKTRGERLSATQLTSSDVVLPSEDMTLAEAKDILADVPAGQRA